MPDLAGRVILVTGAAGGIGRATVVALAAAGATIVAADIAEGRLAETVDRARDVGGTVRARPTDVSRPEEVRALVDGVVADHDRFDGAVNAAAIEFEDTLVTEATDADYDRMMDVNVRSVFLGLREQARAILSLGRPGSIVAIASSSAHRPQPRTPLYTASKHAVLGLVRACAVDLARSGIRVNAISPGAIDTPMLRAAIERRRGDLDRTARALSPMHRFGAPAEVADAVLWLLSDESSFVTGHALAVDGGMLAG